MATVNTHRAVHSANWCTGPRMILTVLGVVDIAISINKMVNAKWKVLKEMKLYDMVCDTFIWINILLNLLIWILDDYITVQHSNCVSSQRFKTMNDATVACSSNTRCIGILEENCDSSLTYYLCQEDIKKDLEVISCVHKKRETIGVFSSHHQDYFAQFYLFTEYLSTILIIQVFLW